MSYRKYPVSKGTRQAHHRRERARRRKLREKGGQVEPFGFADIRGRSLKQLRIMSVTKGQRDGAPRLVDNTDVAKNGQSLPENGHARDSDGTATAAANGDLPAPKDCQARAVSIAQTPPPQPSRKP